MSRHATARRDAFKTRLGVDGLALEAREVPAHLGVFAQTTAVTSSSVLLRDRLFIIPEVRAEQSGDTLYITGTAGDDRVRASNNSGTVQVEASSQGRVSNLPTATFYNVRKIQFVGNAGNDTFTNDTEVPAAAWGGAGNDTLTGGSADDTLVGGDHNDVLDGRGGNDRMWGEGGNDSVTGGEGNDYEDGGAGNDRLAAYWVGSTFVDDTGNDTVFAGAGDDWSDGGLGNDWMQMGADQDFAAGGLGNDTVFGEGGNDFLIGWEGDDELQGGEGDDTLRGQGGRDRLFGNAGNDGLFAGIGDGVETLVGGTGADRFLVMEDVIADLRPEDARVTFRNSGALTGQKMAGQSGTYSFAAGFWDNGQIDRVDVALANLQNATGNTRLLKTAGRGEMSFRAVGMQTDKNAFRSGGWNSGTEITYVNIQGKGDLDVQETVYHEFGHNWDDPSENRYANDFRAVTGWRPHSNGPKGGSLFPPAGYLLSTDAGGTWDYLASRANTFAREYGKTNPKEDMATTWEAYFVNRYHGGAATLTSEKLTANAAKWQTMNSLFWDLSRQP
ncbi:MAG: hypothetical protein K2X82_31265 [Gemmataceae bacterium]|nr:hypothetical protein [Gemmataceae bacterium]